MLLGLVSRHDRAIIEDWTTLCKHLAANITPSHLTLSLFCQVSDYQTAKIVLRSLDFLPPLKRCFIHLRKIPWPALCRLAEDTAHRVTSTPQITGFPFASLPREIQSHVLRFTSLVAPGPIFWHTDTDFNSRTGCCNRCSPVSRFCACPSSQSSYSPICTCWVFPFSLLLLSRALRSIALRIFLSANHFHFTNIHLFGAITRTSAAQVMLTFLNRLPPSCIPYLRYLSLRLANTDTCHPDPKFLDLPRLIEQLENPLQILGTKVHPARLTFTLDLSRIEDCNELVHICEEKRTVLA